MYLDGVWASDTFQARCSQIPKHEIGSFGMRNEPNRVQFGDFLVHDLPFVLSNSTAPYPVNPRWASDGVFPLAYNDVLEQVFFELNLNDEVSLFLNK